MKKGQVYQGIVERVAFPNKGVITLEDGKTKKAVANLPLYTAYGIRTT